jgi:hypothetical protein
MNQETEEKLLSAWAYCDAEDKSTNFMLQYMQDVAGVDLSCVLKFIHKTFDEKRKQWYGKRNSTQSSKENINERTT